MAEFWQGFADAFYRNLLQGGAWRSVLQGLGTTLHISLFSLLFGTLAGAGVCALRRSGWGLLRRLAALYIAVLRGSPVLLLLMLMYYVVFAGSALSAPLVAVAAFSLNTAAHLAELMRSALAAVDRGQVEAARTLGFGRLSAFRLIILPQAARYAKPLYQSTIVNLIQWTSVVGYVTITDLTRVVNNIGSRTMQPLFMICVGVALYLALAYLAYGLFALGDRLRERRAAKRRREADEAAS